VIDAYLAELRRALRPRFLLQKRLLAEAEAHLRDSADALRRSGVASEEAEREAVARFGPAKSVAADAITAAWPRSLLPAALLLLGALVAQVLPLYAIPENTLPPAPWVERPDYLTWKLYGSIGGSGVAFSVALVSLIAAWRGWGRAAAGALLMSLTAFAVSAALCSVLAVQWADAVPGSVTALALSLAAIAFTSLTAGLAATIGVVHAPSRSRRD
jgi:hypothetical protein